MLLVRSFSLCDSRGKGRRERGGSGAKERKRWRVSLSRAVQMASYRTVRKVVVRVSSITLCKFLHRGPSGSVDKDRHSRWSMCTLGAHLVHLSGTNTTQKSQICVYWTPVFFLASSFMMWTQQPSIHALCSQGSRTSLHSTLGQGPRSEA